MRTTKAAARVRRFDVDKIITPSASRREFSKAAQQGFIMVGTPACGIKDPDMPALEVAGAILGSGMSSRLFTELRDKQGLAYAVGLVGFYCAYEVLHRRLHVSEGVGAFGRWARRHHFYHHFHDPAANHGVTSPLWDLVFGTRKVVTEAVVVPEKLAMPWLVDPRSGEVHPHLSGRFTLKARRR